jgi:hypothetical protein
MKIEPFLGVGVIRFGDTRQQVRETLQRPFETFRKNMGENATDAFDEIGLHVYYDGQDRVEFIEGFDPASLTISGLELLGRSIEDVDKELKALGHSSIPTDVGLQFDSAGIVLTASNGIIEGVGIYVRGYYDNCACPTTFHN